MICRGGASGRLSRLDTFPRTSMATDWNSEGPYTRRGPGSSLKDEGHVSTRNGAKRFGTQTLLRKTDSTIRADWIMVRRIEESR